MIKYKKDFII